MADAFTFDDATALLKKKYVMFLGDSNIRSQYKDLVWLLNENTLISNGSLRRRLEETFLGDKLVEGSMLNRGRDFRELREYDDDRTRVDYMFIPRCFNHHIERLFLDFKKGCKRIPDVIVINSCMWDLTRWGPNGVSMYKDNMVKLMRLMSQALPKKTLVIWTTALPPAAHVKGGLIIKQIRCMEPLLRFEVMEANTFARDVVVKHGFDLLDFHFQNRQQIHRRTKDGIHFSPASVRFMTNLLLTHITLSWGRDLPSNITSILLRKAIALDSKPKDEAVKMPTGGIFSRISHKSPVEPKQRGIAITFGTGGNRERQCRIVALPEQPSSSDLKNSQPIRHRLCSQSDDQSETSSLTSARSESIRPSYSTSPDHKDSWRTLRHICNQPGGERKVSELTTRKIRSVGSGQAMTSDSLDARPILRRLYNQPRDELNASAPTNGHAGPIRNQSQKKYRKKLYWRNDRHRYH